MLLFGVAFPVRPFAAAAFVVTVLAVLGAKQLVYDVRHALPAAPVTLTIQLRSVGSVASPPRHWTVVSVLFSICF